MTQITQRIARLRQAMKNAGVSACIIPGTDPHASEYIADYWKEREWISGFDGSAGTVALTLEKGGLWTDSRYFLQGKEQIEGSGIDLMKQGLPETPDMIAWICSVLKAGERVGVNAQMFSVNSYAAMKNELTANGIQLISIDLMAEVWTDRPALPLKPFFVFDTKYCGQSASEKLTALRAELAKANADLMVLSALDDIAWLYNIRGNDVDYNPVVIAYSFVSKDNALLFIENEKITPETKQYLDSQGVTAAPYLDIDTALKAIPHGKSVLIDGAKLNQSLNEAIPLNTPRRNQMSPVFKLKSIKNETEVAGIRWAMVKDGVALTRFFRWLETNLNSGKLTEISIAEKLYEFRSKQENFVGESFGTIAGYKDHGAIVHYRATENSAATLSRKVFCCSIRADNILMVQPILREQLRLASQLASKKAILPLY